MKGRTAMDEKRFVRIYKQETLTTVLEIWMDRDTGVNYLYRRNGYYPAAWTVSVDRDRKTAHRSNECVGIGGMVYAAGSNDLETGGTVLSNP